MKQQISRLSPHQNGKVVAVLAAVVSLIVAGAGLPARLARRRR